MEYMDQNTPENFASSSPIAEVNDVFSRVFLWMFEGLFVTGIIAYLIYSSGLVFTVCTPPLIYVCIIAELVLVIATTAAIRKLSPTIAASLFIAYSAINGVTLSSIFVLYDISSIGVILIETSLLFGVLAFIGYTTKVDVSKWGTVLLVALLVSIVASIINLFIGNTGLDLAITWITLLIFGGLTIYDTNKIKNLMAVESDVKRVAIYGALELYLDFINIFLKLLRLFGKRRN